MKTMLVVLLLTAVGFGQQLQLMSDLPITEQAKVRLAGEHREAMVNKAKRLLTEKKSLEDKLALVNQNLKDIDSGKDQTEDNAHISSSGTAYFSANSLITGDGAAFIGTSR